MERWLNMYKCYETWITGVAKTASASDYDFIEMLEGPIVIFADLVVSF